MYKSESNLSSVHKLKQQGQDVNSLRDRIGSMELNMIAAVQPNPPSSYHQNNEQESNYDQQTEKHANPQKEH